MSVESYQQGCCCLSPPLLHLLTDGSSLLCLFYTPHFLSFPFLTSLVSSSLPPLCCHHLLLFLFSASSSVPSSPPPLPPLLHLLSSSSTSSLQEVSLDWSSALKQHFLDLPSPSSSSLCHHGDDSPLPSCSSNPYPPVQVIHHAFSHTLSW